MFIFQLLKSNYAIKNIRLSTPFGQISLKQKKKSKDYKRVVSNFRHNLHMKNIIILAVISFYLVGCSPLNHLTELELSISESTWDYTDNDGAHYQITFQSNGKVKSTNPNDITNDNDYWNQNRRKIDFNFNDGYSKYSGKMKNLNLIVGKAKSVSGKWNWEMKRIN